MHEKGPEVQRREESLGAGESEEGFFFFFGSDAAFAGM